MNSLPSPHTTAKQPLSNGSAQPTVLDVQTINIFADKNEDVTQLKMKNKLRPGDDVCNVGVIDRGGLHNTDANSPLPWLKTPSLESSHSLPNLVIENNEQQDVPQNQITTSTGCDPTVRNSCTDINSSQASRPGSGSVSSSVSGTSLHHLSVVKNNVKSQSRESVDIETEELQNLLSKEDTSPDQKSVNSQNITVCVNNNNNRLSKVLENIPLLYIPHTKQLVSVNNNQSNKHYHTENEKVPCDSYHISSMTEPSYAQLKTTTDHEPIPCNQIVMAFAGGQSDTASVSSNPDAFSQGPRERTLSNPDSDHSSCTGNVLSQDSDVSITSDGTVTNTQAAPESQTSSVMPSGQHRLNADNFDVISVDSLSKMSIDRDSPRSTLNHNSALGSYTKNLTDASSFSSVSSISTSTDFSMSATSCSEDYHDLKGVIMDTDDAGFMEVNLHSRNSFERSRNSSQDSGIDEKHCHQGAKPKRRTISGFFSRNLFSKKTNKDTSDSDSTPGWKLFGKIPPKEVPLKEPSLITAEYHAKSQAVPPTSQPLSSSSTATVADDAKRWYVGKKHADVEVTSTTGLILETRPQGLPSKTPEEEERHRQEYEAMIEAAKKRELKEARLKRKQQQQQIRVESMLAAAIQIWNTEILTNWENMKNSKKARELWWMGIPPSVRGKVWQLAIGNELNLTSELYEICLSRAKDRIKMALETTESEEATEPSANREASVDLIKLDVSRTFPQLCIFQKGGPYHDFLQSLLGAYACYRPDVGYVQGMSFIAAVLLLNMDVDQAFVCFANLLNKPCQVAFFRMDESLIKSYFCTYEEFLKENLPVLYEHFNSQNLTPDLYIIDWMFTLFSKSLPLDIASRVWDVFCRDGEEFLFRTALGILRLYQDVLLHLDFIHLAQFLTKLPENICSERLFRNIDCIRMLIDKRKFGQVLADNKEVKMADT